MLRWPLCSARFALDDRMLRSSGFIFTLLQPYAAIASFLVRVLPPNIPATPRPPWQLTISLCVACGVLGSQLVRPFTHVIRIQRRRFCDPGHSPSTSAYSKTTTARRCRLQWLREPTDRPTRVHNFAWRFPPVTPRTPAASPAEWTPFLLRPCSCYCGSCDSRRRVASEIWAGALEF